ncbi:acetate kinase [Nakamurella antarctica]|uniref:Acetate kinase n=1 Tax=Nakamurella antarctica TaxID=1902245 RepID=A0A3G8ZIF7_9ACTN|nr:acetate kinase [Nakamurella antarctica]AZI57103.1 acetate kinase [Nakamurella antarctica]
MDCNVLVFNCGSSSIKFQLLKVDTEQVLAKGSVERVGSIDGTITFESAAGETTANEPVPDHAAGMTLIREAFKRGGFDLDNAGIVAIGHRVVHGGAAFSAPVLINDEALTAMRDVSVLAPLHNPANIIGIERASAAFPKLPQVAVFDTAFFQNLPAAASTYAVDRQLASDNGIRRYGFHGTSHQYVSGRVPLMLNRDPSELNQIVLHLGNGASVAAIRGGAPVETSMGMTPLEGLVMGTRSGDIDAGVIFHLHRVAGMSVDQIDTALNRKSGMVGLSGVNDFRDLHALVAGGDHDAQLALDVYIHRIKKYVGAYSAILGRLDAITFTAGIGENDSIVRSLALAGLEGFGIVIDSERNNAKTRGARVISADDSRVAVLVVPTNEELEIAQQTLDVVKKRM